MSRWTVSTLLIWIAVGFLACAGNPDHSTDPDRIRSLVTALGSNSEEERNEAARELMKMDRGQLREMTPEMLELLRDEDGGKRLSAAEVMGELGVTEAVPELVRWLKESKHIAYDGAAYRALRLIGKDAALFELLPLLRYKDPTVRETAIKLIGDLRATEAVPHLRQALRDKEGGVKRAAIKVLGDLRAKEATEDIARFLDPEAARHIDVAATALAKLDAKESIPLIAHWVKRSPRSWVDRAIVRALCILGSPKGIEEWLDRASKDKEIELDPLNAVRRPDVWARLDGKQINWKDEEFEGWGKFYGRQAGLKWDTSGVAPEETVDWVPTWESMDLRGASLRTVLVGLTGLNTAGYAYILEPDRLRILPREKALQFWKEWWSQKK